MRNQPWTRRWASMSPRGASSAGAITPSHDQTYADPHPSSDNSGTCGRTGVLVDLRAPLHVLHILPSLPRAGAETALYRLIAHSKPAMLRHTVIAFKGGGPLAAAMREAGATVITLRLAFRPSAVSETMKLLGLVRQMRPDIIQGWMIHANVLAWIARATVCPSSALAWNLRITAHDLVHENRMTRFLTNRAATLSKTVDLLISNSSVGLTEHRQLGYSPQATAVVPNGFDTSLFKPDPKSRLRMRADFGFANDDVVFGLIGRFHPQKGHRAFVAAAAIVADRYPQSRFLLVGDGLEGNPELARWLAVAGLTGRFTILASRPDVHNTMRALDVACAPSLYEGFPNVVGEAMSSGVACVATAVSDVPLILKSGGLVVPPNDIPALAAAMAAMIEMGVEGRRDMGALGRERVRQIYSIDDVARRYEALYENLRERAVARPSGEPQEV